MSDSPTDDPFHVSEMPPGKVVPVEEFAHRFRPLSSVGKPAQAGVSAKADSAITYSRVREGLDKLIARLGEVRGMSEVVRESLTREAPKDFDLTSGAPVQTDGPIFEQLARLTLDLSREIERTEKNLALALAVLK